MKTIFSKVTLQKKQIGILAVFIFFSSVGEMLLPSLLAQMINKGVAKQEHRSILIFMALMCGICVFACILNFVSVKIASRISTEFAAKLRAEVFTKVQSFSSAELDQFGTASLVTRSTSDITNIVSAD